MTWMASSCAFLFASARVFSIFALSAAIISKAFCSASATAFWTSSMACRFTSFTASSMQQGGDEWFKFSSPCFASVKADRGSARSYTSCVFCVRHRCHCIFFFIFVTQVKCSAFVSNSVNLHHSSTILISKLMVFLPAFLQISSVTYAEPGRGANSRWESVGKQRQKGLAPARAYKDIKMIHCWNNGWLCDWQLNQGNRCSQREATDPGSDNIAVISSFIFSSMQTGPRIWATRPP